MPARRRSTPVLEAPGRGRRRGGSRFGHRCGGWRRRERGSGRRHDGRRQRRRGSRLRRWRRCRRGCRGRGLGWSWRGSGCGCRRGRRCRGRRGCWWGAYSYTGSADDRCLHSVHILDDPGESVGTLGGGGGHGRRKGFFPQQREGDGLADDGNLRFRQVGACARHPVVERGDAPHHLEGGKPLQRSDGNPRLDDARLDDLDPRAELPQLRQRSFVGRPQVDLDLHVPGVVKPYALARGIGRGGVASDISRNSTVRSSALLGRGGFQGILPPPIEQRANLGAVLAGRQIRRGRRIVGECGGTAKDQSQEKQKH